MRTSRRLTFRARGTVRILALWALPWMLAGLAGCDLFGREKCDIGRGHWCEGDKVMGCETTDVYAGTAYVAKTCKPGMCNAGYCKATTDPCPEGATAICLGDVLATCHPNRDVEAVENCAATNEPFSPPMRCGETQGQGAKCQPGPWNDRAHSCAVRSDGSIACWGSNYGKECTPPAGTFTAVTVGFRHSCGMRTDGTVACWGFNFYGQATPPKETFVAVSAGDYYTCGIKTDRTVVCWGGYKTWTEKQGEFSPKTNQPEGTINALSAGSDYTCAVRSDDTVACWGNPAAPSLVGAFSSVSAGLSKFACGLRREGIIVCSGADSFGQATPPEGPFVSVSAGKDHACAIKTDGTVVCWGNNNFQQATPPDGTFLSIKADGNHTCGIRSDGSLACWGNNDYGQSTPPTGTFVSLD